MNDMRKLIKLAESVPFGGGERCPDCYGAGHYEGEEECPRCEGFGEIYPDDSFHSEFAVEDCDETPEGGEDGECSPFTHADDNVDMVREEDDEDDYHMQEVQRFMDMGKRDLWILYNDTLEDNDPEDHDALQYMEYALRQMGVHMAEGAMDEDFLVPPKDAKYDDRQDAMDRFEDDYASDMEDRATSGPDFEDDDDYDFDSDPLMRGGEDGLGPDGHGYDRIPEDGPGDEDEFDADPDAMVDVGDDEDYEEFDFDNEFDRMMGNTYRFDEDGVMEMNKLRKMAGLEQVDEAKSAFPNMEEWWTEDPSEIMSFVYWRKRQLPPADKRLYAKNWNSLVSQLSAKNPPPEGWENPIPAPGPFEIECSRCQGRKYDPTDKVMPCIKCDGEGVVQEAMKESAPHGSDDYVAFTFDDEKAYFLVADECGEQMEFGMRDECLIPDQWVDQVLVLLKDNGFEKGKDFSVAGMEEDLQNGYNQQRMDKDDVDGDDRFPKGAANSPASNTGPAGAKHGDNPMRTPMASVDKEEDDIYESYKHQYRRFRRK